MPASTVVQAWRSWRRDRQLFALATAALALGISATTAIYTVVNAVMIRPLAYAHGERFVQLFGGTVGQPEARSSLSFDDVIAYRDRASSFEAFGWFSPATYRMTSPGPPQYLQGAAVTVSLANSLGVAPALGRWFDADGEAVISRGLWQRLGGTPSVLGTALTLDGRPYVVTGVMPGHFRLPEIGHAGDNVANDVWVPLPEAADALAARAGFLFPYARLRPDTTFAAARAEVEAVAAAIARAAPASHPAYTARIFPLREMVAMGIRPTLMLLLAAATLLFLVTCGNVGTLLLSRAVARSRERSICVALGAGRGRLAAQFLFESLFVSLAGAAAGIVISIALVRAVLGIAGDFIPRAGEVMLDWRVLLVALTTGGLASALSSLAPLWLQSRTRPSDVLGTGLRATAAIGSRRMARWLVVAEVALAFLLVAVGSVLMADLAAIRRIPGGFDLDGLLAFQVDLPADVAARDDARVATQRRLMDALASVPGVERVGFANQTPLDGCCLSTSVYPDGAGLDASTPQKVAILPISPGYVQALGVPLRRGRLLDYGDADSDVLAVLVNEACVRQYWRGREALGTFGRVGGADGARFRVVGVVGDIRNDGIERPTVPEIYLLHTAASVNPMHVVVRSRLPMETLLPRLRQAVQGIDPSQPLQRVTSFPEILEGSLALQRVRTFVTGLFAVAALLMAAVGIYGVVSYTVRQRMVEFGTRMALGAAGRDVGALVVGGGARMSVQGLALGTMGTTAALWLLLRGGQIQSVSWIAVGIAGIAVATLTLSASLSPAWRVARTSPVDALRDFRQPAAARRRDVRQAAGRLGRLIRDAATAVLPAEAPDLPEFVEAARRAEGPAQAVALALASLRDRVGAEWALLLQAAGTGSYATVAADGAVGLDRDVPDTGFLTNRLAHYSAALPIDAGDLEAWLAWAAAERPQHLDEIAALRQADAAMAIALRSRDTLTAVLVLGRPAGHPHYSAADRRLVRRAASQLTLMLEHARLAVRLLEQEKIRRDVELATAVQRRLLPAATPARAGSSWAASTRAARRVAGDCYDFLDLRDGRVAVALADVSGKGVSAALVMSVVQASLRVLAAETEQDLPSLAASMNDYLFRSTQSSSYATFFFAAVDDRRRELEYVNAGHNPPVLVRTRRDGRPLEQLAVGGTVLGLFPGMTFDSARVALDPGDVLVIYTDGVAECMNGSDEEFGEDRLHALVRDAAGMSCDEIASRITAALASWSAGAEQHDDETFVVMQVR